MSVIFTAPIRLYVDRAADFASSRINATGVYNGSKHALAQMVNQDPDAKGSRGRIINVSSVMGLVASAGGAGK